MRVARGLHVGACFLLLVLWDPTLGVAQDERDEQEAQDVLPPRVVARHDVILRWAPRYQLDATTDPVGLEQRFWRRVSSLPLYHRAALDATRLAGGFVDLHFVGWGTIDTLLNDQGGIAAGDVAIGYLEVNLQPVRIWAGRRFMVFGPPGGLHVDGVGTSLRTSRGIATEVFFGRPVTPARDTLIGPEPDFEGASVAFGARVGYSDPGIAAASAGYAERWGHGLVASRTIDLSVSWDPGRLHVEGGAKVDVLHPGIAQATLTGAMRFEGAWTCDLGYLHLEPGRWIPPWSILSVFESSTYDELAAGTTWRPRRALAMRAELAGRVFSHAGDQSGAPLGYRAELTARITPIGAKARSRVLVSRRGDGVLGYTLVTAGVAFDPRPDWTLAFDGAFAIDDDGGRDSLLARTTAETAPADDWKVGVTLSLARTRIVQAEARAMLRATWTPKVRLP